MNTIPGIEIRVLPPDVGEPWFIGNSSELHFELAAAWIHVDCPPDTWHPIAAGNMRLEIRAVELPALPSGEELLGELAAQERAAAAAAGADDESSAVDQAAAELAARRRLHTCSSCPSPEGCAAFAECLIARTLSRGPGQTAAPVPETDTGAVALTDAGQATGRPAGLGRAIARIARRARFRSARCTCRAVPR